MTDTITNHSHRTIAIAIAHKVATPDRGEVLLAGAPQDSEGTPEADRRRFGKRVLRALGLRAPTPATHVAENPTAFITGAGASIGVVLEDSISRLKGVIGEASDGAALQMRPIAIGAGTSLAFRWALYPVPRDDYFAFINELRTDWGVNFTVEGPWGFFDLIRHRVLLRDPDRLRAYFERTGLRAVALTPWLDYDNYDWSRGLLLSRAEYADLARRAYAAIRAVAPAVRITGCIQSNLVTPPSDVSISLYGALTEGERTPGIRRCTDAQMRVLRAAKLPFRECMLMDADGRHTFELYHSGPQRQPSIALAVYATPGNWNAQRWVESGRFLLDEVGLDGAYIDQFSLAFRSTPDQRYSYDRWDGLTVEVDANGEITRQLTDAAWAGIEPQREFIEFMAKRGAFLVTNTQASAAETQSRPVMRFMEASGAVTAVDFKLGRKPGRSRTLSGGQLASPIALGYQAPATFDAPDKPRPELVMQQLIAQLRHGLLNYHVEAANAGNLGEAVALMFPFTPRALHAGWIEGVERTVTAISGEFRREQQAPPTIVCFDSTGAKRFQTATVTGGPGAWAVRLSIRDWSEVAVIAHDSGASPTRPGS